MLAISKDFNRMTEIYKIFIPGPLSDNFDFSEEAKLAMYEYETHGRGNCNVDDMYLEYLLSQKKINAYAVGKKYMNITVAGWFDEMKHYGWANVIQRLYADLEFPRWWLDSIFERFVKDKQEEYRDLGLLENCSWTPMSVFEEIKCLK